MLNGYHLSGKIALFGWILKQIERWSYNFICKSCLSKKDMFLGPNYPSIRLNLNFLVYDGLSIQTSVNCHYL